MKNQTTQPKPEKDIKNLRSILFEQLNAIRAAESSKQLELEKERGKAMLPIADALLDTARLELDFIGKLNTIGTGFIPNQTDTKKALPLSHDFDK